MDVNQLELRDTTDEHRMDNAFLVQPIGQLSVGIGTSYAGGGV